jgi:ribonuclease HI
MAEGTPQIDAGWRAWFDGSALPNPGRMGIGFVLQAPDGSTDERSFVTREVGCNNEAELNALCALLELAREKGARHLQVYGDSDVAVKYANGVDSTEIERLHALVLRTQDLLRSFDAVSLSWVPRHRNEAADELARRALGLPPKPARNARRGRR